MSAGAGMPDAGWDRPAEAVFFRPGIDRGLWLLDPPRDWWRLVAPGRIAAAAIAQDVAERDRVAGLIAEHHRTRAFARAVETASVPVLAEGLRAEGAGLRIGGRWLLSGEAGTALRDAHAGAAPEADAREALAEARHRDPYPPALWPGGAGGLDLVLPAVMPGLPVERLGQIAYAVRPDFTGRIVVPGADAALGAWIDALYPSLAGRLVASAPGARRALSVLNGRHLHAQTGGNTMPSMGLLGPEAPGWKGRDADRASLAMLAANGYDEALRRLREVGLARAAGRGGPRLFWLDGGMVAPALEAGMRARGLVPLRLDALAPLDQVAAMEGADLVVDPHGTDLAHMVFAGTGTQVVGIGPLAGLDAWERRMPAAHVSGCRHASLFTAGAVPDAPECGRVLDWLDVALGRAPAVGATPWLAAMADMAQRLRDWDGLRALLAGNREAALRDADLTIRLADLAEEDRDLPRAVDLLERAWRATGDRPFLLERLIVLAARIGVTGRWDAEHARAFPDRADRLARRLRRQAGGGA